MPPVMGQRVPLGEMVQALRAELQAALEADPGYQLNTLEMEVEVAVERESQTEGPVRFYVIEANAGDDDERETHTFRINIGPAGVVIE